MNEPVINKKNGLNTVINKKRRNFIKFGLFGLGAFVMGKLLSPLIPFFGDTGKKTYLFENFKVVENNKELGFYDSDGNEIMVIEKD